MQTVINHIGEVQGKFEGGVSFTVNWYNILKEGAQALLSKMAPKTLNISVPIYGGVVSGICMYLCPEDVAAPNSIQNNAGDIKYDYVAPDAFQAAMFQGRPNIFTITYLNGARFIILSTNVGVSSIIINQMDTTAGVTGDMTLTLNTRDFVSGSSSIQGTFSDTDTKIGGTFAQPVDIASFLYGTELVPFKLQDPRKVASVSVRLFTDVSNYWTISMSDGLSYLIKGWNMGRFPLADRVATGTPDEANIMSWELEVEMKTGESQLVIIDQLSLQNTALLYLNYTSNAIFIDKDTFLRKTAPSNDEDLIDLTDEEMEIFKYENCMVTVQEATTDKVNANENVRFLSTLREKYNLYYAKNPSNEMPMSYNISPNIAKRPVTDFESIGRIPEYIRDASAITPATVSYNETMVGVQNSVNTQFQLLHLPNPTLSLQITKNGMIQTLGVDYTVTGKVVTFAVAPDPLDIIRAQYEY